MTDPSIHEIQHDVNTRIAAFGEELAREISPKLALLVKAHIDEMGDELDHNDPLWRDIFVPALAWHTLLHVANAICSQSDGWADVFFRNLRERYEKERGKETK